MAQTLTSPPLLERTFDWRERGRMRRWTRWGAHPNGQLRESAGRRLLQMRAHVGLQDPAMRLLEGRAPLDQLMLPMVFQRPISALRGSGQDCGQGGGRKPQGDVERRSALTSPEAAQKTIRQTRATRTKMTEKIEATEDGKGARGDLPSSDKNGVVRW